MPWYSRLDEWHHQKTWGRAWYYLWRPFCCAVDRTYRRTGR